MQITVAAVRATTPQPNRAPSVAVIIVAVLMEHVTLSIYVRENWFSTGNVASTRPISTAILRRNQISPKRRYTHNLYDNCTHFRKKQNNVYSSLRQVKNDVKDCNGKPDGYYQDAESGCRSYFYCASGMKAIYVCSGKTLFDGQRCVEASTYQCPYSSSDCKGASNGYQADLSSGCRNYYFCSGDGHKLITLTCSEEKLFDGKKCVDANQYRCPSEEPSRTKNAESYYSYSSPAVRQPSAIDKTYFVSSRNNGGIINSPSTTTTTTIRPGDYCEKNYGFFVVHGTGCRSYYICIAGTRTNLQCSGNTVFNGQVCVDQSQYECPELKSDCRGKSDGIYTDQLSGCRNYFFCLGEVQTNLSCPEGQLFDGRKCADSQRVTCAVEGRSSSLAINPCSGRPNGLYPDHSFPGCRNYLYCRSGRPYGPAGRCTRSERFSGQHSRCVPKYEVECRTTEDTIEDEQDYMMAESSGLVTVVVDDEITATTVANSATTEN